MDDTWVPNVSQLMMGVAMSDSREMGNIQSVCASDEVQNDLHHQHISQQNSTATEDADQNHQDLQNHQNSLEHEYFRNQVSLSLQDQTELFLMD